MEHMASCEAGALSSADGRCYFHVTPKKEMLPAGSGHTDQDTLTFPGGHSLGLVQRCAITGRSMRWDVMVLAGGLHRGTHDPPKGYYVHLVIFCSLEICLHNLGAKSSVVFVLSL